MSQNIEIKAVYPDLKKGQHKARALAAQFIGTDHQIDTYFNVPRGRLKLRESALSGNQLIPYLRPDEQTAKKSQYVLLPVQDPSAVKELLTRMFGIRLIVEKERHIYLWQNVRIHLDQVKNLGTFLEFEAVIDEEHAAEICREQVRFLLTHFEIPETNLLARSYADLLTERVKLNRKGQNNHV